MRQHSAAQPVEERQFLSEKLIWRWLILGFLFVCALVIRVHGINEYPLDFHPVKQYRSALTARAYYIEKIDSIPEWKREVARANVRQLGRLGPTILERTAAFAYLVTGAEHLWIPRLLSSLFWVIGGVFLYLIARKMASTDAAIVSTAFYLFLPFGVMASQSFQIDPLMVMMMNISLFAIVRFHEVPSRGRLWVAATTSAIAILSKPVCLFIIFGAFAALAIDRRNVHKTILDPEVWIFIVVSLLPAVLFYGYEIVTAGILRSQGQITSFQINLQSQARISFLPRLLLEPFFWQFWLKHIYRVIGFAALVGGLLGVLLLPPDWRRKMIIGLWIGYLVYGLLFTYHIHTHNYYQLPFIPVVALSLGPLGAMVLNHFIRADSRWRRRMVVGSIFFLAVFLNIGLYLRARQELPDFTRDVKMAEEIGDVVAHSTHTLFLAPYGGRPLQYHGELSGELWPTLADIRAERLIGEPELSIEERFQALSAIIVPEYFIVTNFDEYAAQEDLQEFLTTNFPVVVQEDDYIIFDLREALGDNGSTTEQ